MAEKPKLLARVIRKIRIWDGRWYVNCSPTELLELVANGATLIGFGGWNRTMEQIQEAQVAGDTRGFRYGLKLNDELERQVREHLSRSNQEVPPKGRVKPMTRRGPGKYGASRPQK